MRPLPLVVLLGLVLSGAGATGSGATGAGAASLDLSGPVPSQAVVVRVNLTEDSDLTMHMTVSTCVTPDSSGPAVALFRVTDGFLESQLTSPGGISYSVGRRTVAAGIEGHVVELPSGLTGDADLSLGSSCGVGHQWWTAVGDNRTVVLAGATSGEDGAWHVWANATRGVVSYDISLVPFRALTRDDFAQGVHATVHAPMAPAVGAGAALRERVVATADLAGYWWPDGYEVGQPWCTRDGGDCVLAHHWFSAKAGTVHEFGYETSASTHSATKVLAYLQFPDGTYLAEQAGAL